jgi:hypothetical protein
MMEVLMKTKPNLIDHRDWLRYRQIHLDGLFMPEPPRPKICSAILNSDDPQGPR